jgi:GntR family transcriptional regulator
VKQRPSAYDGSVPLHHQIQRVLRSKIEAGEWADGDRFPTEMTLVRRFRVSRTTIRQALGTLEQARLIRRHRGSGSFVTLNGAGPTSPPKVTNLVLGYDAHIQVIGVETVPAPPHVTEFLGLSRGQTVRRFVRVEEIGGGPLAVVANHVPVGLARRIRLRDLRRLSMLELLRDRLHIPIGMIRHSIEARMPDDEVASLLRISLTDPVLVLRLFVSDRAGRPLEVADTFYRADRYRYEIDMPLPERSRAARSVSRSRRRGARRTPRRS